jgi:pimeloyl-ACP methyl ester carboxylesterase
MRRLIGITLLLAAGVATLAWRRAVGMGLPKPVTGMSANGMAYARWGEGGKTLLLMPGGPGNIVPGGIGLWMMLREFRRFVEEGYTLWYVVRKQGMPEGHSIADMADDYAEFIGADLAGRVDVVLGTSYGGIIGFYLAARHPDRFGNIAIALAGYEVSERGKRIDYGFAQKLSEGRSVEAAKGMFEDLYPDLRIPGLARLFGEVMGRFGFRDTHPTFASDVMIEADAEVAVDAKAVLPGISVPVLLIGGAEDVLFPREILEETARLIPDCTLRMYEGRGHAQAISDSRFCPDVIDFLERDH